MLPERSWTVIKAVKVINYSLVIFDLRRRIYPKGKPNLASLLKISSGCFEWGKPQPTDSCLRPSTRALHVMQSEATDPEAAGIHCVKLPPPRGVIWASHPAWTYDNTLNSVSFRTFTTGKTIKRGPMGDCQDPLNVHIFYLICFFVTCFLSCPPSPSLSLFLIYC